MADILPFKRPKKRKLSEIHKGKTLCKSGFHKWEISKDKQFNSRQGRLVTLYVCQRCGAHKSLNLEISEPHSIQRISRAECSPIITQSKLFG
jgi:hypothetical protein